VIDNHILYERYGTTRTLCEFVTNIAYAMEASGGLNDGLSDRMDELVAPVRSARDWLWHVGQLMTQMKPLPSDFGNGLDRAEARALDALPKLKILIAEACDVLAGANAHSAAAESVSELV
jgi:hypothetical protein